MMNTRDYLLKLWNFWPPFLFSGISAEKVSKDYRHIVSRLKLRFWNANFVGTQYGGSIFSLADPFYMIMLIKNLGPEYVVWDKSARINYLKPGKTDLSAEFKLSEEDLEGIRKAVAETGKIEWSRVIDIKNAQGEIVAQVEKIISIKKKHSHAK